MTCVWLWMDKTNFKWTGNFDWKKIIRVFLQLCLTNLTKLFFCAHRWIQLIMRSFWGMYCSNSSREMKKLVVHPIYSNHYDLWFMTHESCSMKYTEEVSNCLQEVGSFLKSIYHVYSQLTHKIKSKNKNTSTSNHNMTISVDRISMKSHIK